MFTIPLIKKLLKRTKVYCNSNISPDNAFLIFKLKELRGHEVGRVMSHTINLTSPSGWKSGEENDLKSGEKNGLRSEEKNG